MTTTVPPRPDLGWTDDEWRQFEAAWTHVAAKQAPPERGFSWLIFGWSEAKKAWITGLVGTVAGALIPVFSEGRVPTWEDLWMPVAGAVVFYLSAWIPGNKPPPEGTKP